MDGLGLLRVDFRRLIRRGTEKCDFKAKTSTLGWIERAPRAASYGVGRD